jgi:hypothetical protein
MMRMRLAFWARACPLVLIAATAFGQPGWQETRSPEGRFTAKFPSAPQQTTKPMRTALGNLSAHLYLVEQKGEPFYAIAYVDYPKARIAGKKTDELLDKARDSAVANVGGKLVSETPITLAGFPGREVRVEKIRGDMVLVCRLFLAEERLYQALVVVARSKESPELTRAFLDGFVLGK